MTEQRETSPEPRRLDPAEITAALADLPGWQLVDGKLARRFALADFVEAMDFMARAAVWAQRMNHHPDWSNAYNVVRVELQTHDVGGITSADVALARKMTDLAEGEAPQP